MPASCGISRGDLVTAIQMTPSDEDVGGPIADISAARTRMLLTDVWHNALNRLTELSVLLHTLDGDDERHAEIEARLAATRRTLVEVEAELERLRLRAG